MLLRRSRVLSSANVVLVLKESALDAVLEGFDVHGVFDASGAALVGYLTLHSFLNSYFGSLAPCLR